MRPFYFLALYEVKLIKPFTITRVYPFGYGVMRFVALVVVDVLYVDLVVFDLVANVKVTAIGVRRCLFYVDYHKSAILAPAFYLFKRASRLGLIPSRTL